MKLPRLRDLTEAQKNVYLYAPTDSHVLVSGPPGTGKTLIAALRATELRKQGVPVMLGMFNQVLARYTANLGADTDDVSSTLSLWFIKWWQKSGLPPHPATDDLILEVPYAARAEAKAKGARFNDKVWQPWAKRKGVWMIDSARYHTSPESFSSWQVWHKPPQINGQQYDIDWDAVSRHLMDHDESLSENSLAIGSLIVDEGQDFPRNFYVVLRTIAALGKARKVQHPLRCLVLADENQSLTGRNSTLSDITEALKIAADHRFVLEDNFRNTREIAELSRAFYADVGTLPKLPARSGPRPEFEPDTSLAACAERIRIWVNNNPGKEVGVLVFRESRRKEVQEALQQVLTRMRGREITVQSYSFESRKENPVKDLIFDKGDVVTVINLQSCKGLEFDAVFIVEPGDVNLVTLGRDKFKMQMFVATSRGRTQVSIIDSGPANRPFAELLPDETVLERTGTSVVGTSAIRTGTIRRVSSPPSRSPGTAEEGELKALDLARRNGLKVADKRATGGALWIEAGPEYKNRLAKLGFSFSEKRQEWWKK